MFTLSGYLAISQRYSILEGLGDEYPVATSVHSVSRGYTTQSCVLMHQIPTTADGYHDCQPLLSSHALMLISNSSKGWVLAS